MNGANAGWNLATASARFAAMVMVALLTPQFLAGHSRCPAVVAAEVEVIREEVTLADLLTADSCLPIRQTAGSVRLGRVPLAGSSRVFDGEAVRAQFSLLLARSERLDQLELGPHLDEIEIPSRITVRRGGSRATCAGIAERLRLQLAPEEPPSEFSAGVHCGIAGRIPSAAALAFGPPVWSSGLARWQVPAHCLHADECVPFLIEIDRRSLPEKIGLAPNSGVGTAKGASIPPLPALPPVIASGQRVTLIWDQNGIRLVVPAVSLDAGGVGDPVRARLGNGGRALHARVEGAGVLRVESP